MKQLFQNLKNGKVKLEEIPVPTVNSGDVLIKTLYSLISPGTERMLSDFGKSSFIQKAKSQPDKVKQVLQKVKTDGVKSTLQSVKSKLDEPMSLGYCNVGEVLEVGPNVLNLAKGDLVVSNGAHSECVVVKENLCAKIPDNLSPKSASLTVLGAIALQGVRLSKPELGETYVVLGLGVIGLLTTQILIANGVKVIAFDFDKGRVEIAKKSGALAYQITDEINPSEIVLSETDMLGCDSVIITAATKSNQPIEDAPKMCRKRGRIILTGVSGLNINRNDFYAKEISFQVSCSYGPGRYEDNYENKGLDYPISFVRWTENRNFKAVLDLLSNHKINPDLLINSEINFIDAETEYDKTLRDSSLLGVLFRYEYSKDYKKDRVIEYNSENKEKNSKVNVGIIGAGNFARATLLPALKGTKANLIGIASSTGKNSASMANKYGFKYCCTDYQDILKDNKINTVFILTRHNEHAKICIEALKANKNVFIEKPLAITDVELKEIKKIKKEKPELKVMLGFNRRFSPLILKCYETLKNSSAPTAINMLINSGELPSDFWLNDPFIGGGRLIGEACHFIDLALFLCQSEIVNSNIVSVPSTNNYGSYETFSINLLFKNGSIANINYFSNGSKKYPKEQIHIFNSGKIFEIDNFIQLKSYGLKNELNIKLNSQDKGHKKGIEKFIESIEKGEKSPINFLDILSVSELAINLTPKIEYKNASNA